MSNFTYEQDLPHQTAGVNAVLAALNNAYPQAGDEQINPLLQLNDEAFCKNISELHRLHSIDSRFVSHERILDIAMETGTGKTYTYAKTMFELHRVFGLHKFIVAVPTLSIKAGARAFLENLNPAKAFGAAFDGVQINIHLVESQKNNKGKKELLPQALWQFLNGNNGKKELDVLLINAGMINADTMNKTFSQDLFGGKTEPFEAVAEVRPVLIIDEPHRFDTQNKTWCNIQRFRPQLTLRYGATFPEKEISEKINGKTVKTKITDHYNLIYRLTAVEAFNQNLVKGIQTFVQSLGKDDKTYLKLIALDGTEAEFELIEQGEKQTFKLGVKENLSRIHHAIHDLYIERMNKSVVELSNGITLNKGSHINPYSYDLSLEDQMMQLAIKEHFKLERQMLTASPKIKPLTLFFIDDIAGYRNGNELAGSLKSKFESWVKAEAECRLETETDEFYKAYLEKTLADLSLVHGGYFSQDNSETDEKIEQQINEILHDKEKLLSLDNSRRFIFSKWTLREGWDNPNVFQICKLRSSGSQISKLQEVGRGLRLPVNERMNRVAGNFTLNYFVDSSEQDFVNRLISEVNEKSFQEIVPTKFTEELKQRILQYYPQIKPLALLRKLSSEEIIDDDENFTENGYAELKKVYPLAFPQGLIQGKIRNNGDKKPKIKMRIGLYDELKMLWETINQKALLEYKITNEADFLQLFSNFLYQNASRFKQAGVTTQVNLLKIANNELVAGKEERDDLFVRYNTMSYREFLEKLAQKTKIQIATLHKAFYAVRGEFAVEEFLNLQTISQIHQNFNEYLLHHSLTKAEVGKMGVDVDYHLMGLPSKQTAFTDKNGNELNEIDSSHLGVFHDNGIAAEHYLFDEIFYDSEIEKNNIQTNIGKGDKIEEVVVFTKIPKNSIKIPVAGGGTYSPDFAYIVKTTTGEILNFVIEAKGVVGDEILREREKRKIKHAEKLFAKIAEKTKVVFRTQFEGERIIDLIKGLV